MEINEILKVMLAGAIGGLTNEILDDGALTLPAIKEGKFYLGFLGSVALGALAGYLVDGSFITAMTGGYMGHSVITAIIAKKNGVKITL